MNNCSSFPYGLPFIQIPKRENAGLIFPRLRQTRFTISNLTFADSARYLP
jgi:hypothetical protein